MKSVNSTVTVTGIVNDSNNTLCNMLSDDINQQNKKFSKYRLIQILHYQDFVELSLVEESFLQNMTLIS